MNEEGNKLANILIVDDEKEIRSYLTDLLTENNFNVFTAENGMKALEVIDKKKIDIVLADVVMPKMDGIALTRSIKEINPDIPVILMTAYASIEYAVESMKAGAADFISKPFKVKYALFIIKKVLETKQLEEKAKKTEYYKELSNIDALTSIHNYRFFKEMLENEIKRHKRYKRDLSFLLIDIDDFFD
jgi:PleD family two-component response regulator